MNYISQQEPNQMWIKKVLMLVLADILIVLISYFMALLLRFDFVFSSIPEEYLMGYLWSMPFWIISTIVMRNINTGETVEFEVTGDKIEAIHMIPGWTHNIINLSKTENLVTVMTCNEVFNPEKPDTFFEPV